MMTEASTRPGFSRRVDAAGLTERCRNVTESTVESYPLSTTVGVFAIGLSLGVAVGASLSRPLRLNQKNAAESLGRRVLEALQEYVPGSVNQYLRS